MSQLVNTIHPLDPPPLIGVLLYPPPPLSLHPTYHPSLPKTLSRWVRQLTITHRALSVNSQSTE